MVINIAIIVAVIGSFISYYAIFIRSRNDVASFKKQYEIILESHEKNYMELVDYRTKYYEYSLECKDKEIEHLQEANEELWRMYGTHN